MATENPASHSLQPLPMLERQLICARTVNALATQAPGVLGNQTYLRLVEARRNRKRSTPPRAQS